MSRSNNNQNKNKNKNRNSNNKLAKIERENKAMLQQLQSVQKKLNNSIQNPSSYTNKARGSKKFLSSNFVDFPFSLATRRYASLVKNPIHSRQPEKMPDLNTAPSLTFSDYIITMGATTIDIETVTPVTSCEAMIFFLTYGPTGLLNGSVGDFAKYPWRVFAVPINSSGEPIKNDNGTVIRPTIMTNANTNAILALVTQMRLVAAGIRINSMNELTTDSDSQYVESFIPGEMTLRDFEFWYYADPPFDITASVLQAGNSGVFKNSQGAAARYMPLQANQGFLSSYYESGVLTSTADSNNWNAEQLYFPYIYVKLHQDAAITTMSLDGYKPIFNTNKVKKQQQMMQNFMELNDPERKYEEMSSSPIEHVYLEKRLSNGNSILVPKDVGTPVVYHITFPIRLEVKYWCECQVAIPTPLNISPSPSEQNWDRFIWWLHQKANFPRFTDGHSFTGLINRGARFARKNLTRRKVRNGFNYATGMIGDVRTGLSDLSGALT